MRTGFDISNPLDQVVGGYDVAGGYIGGATPHVWTPQQWNSQTARWRAPFWLCDPARDPAVQGDDIVAKLKSLGAPRGCIVLLDMETRTDAHLVNGIANVVHAGGYNSGVYGSESTVFGNPPRSGYMVALYDGVEALYEHPHSIGKQYADMVKGPGGLIIDLDVWADSCPLWDTHSQAVSPRPPWVQSAIASLSTAVVAAEQARQTIITATS